MIYNFNYENLVFMEGKHFLIKFIFSTFRKRIVVGRMEEQRFWSREDTGIDEF